MFIIFNIKEKMFSNLARRAFTQTFIRSRNSNSNSIRNLYWTRRDGEFKYIGLESSTIDIYEGINNIKFPKENMILKGEPLFEVDSNTILDGIIESKKDTLIVDTNQRIMNTINFNPEEKNSWILKVRDIETESKSYGKFLRENPNASKEERLNAIKNFLDSTRNTPYTYYSSPNDYTKDKDNIKYNTNTENTPYYPHTNVNESDLIYYILSNH